MMFCAAEKHRKVEFDAVEMNLNLRAIRAALQGQEVAFNEQ
jgi:hypothetical protein